MAQPGARFQRNDDHRPVRRDDALRRDGYDLRGRQHRSLRQFLERRAVRPVRGGGQRDEQRERCRTTRRSRAALACTARPPIAGDAGVAFITDFSSISGDGAAGSAAYFGSYSTSAAVFGGGSYAYGTGPGTDSLADPSAGVYCTTLGSQSSLVATATPGLGMALSGTVATFSGVGLYLYHCVDASAFQGVEFTISGDVGNEAAQDAGPSNQIAFSVSMLPDLTVSSGTGSTCTLGGGCASPSYTFTVPAQPTTMRVPFSQLTGGAPLYVLDPSQIDGLQWALPWPCTTNPMPYPTHLIITNVGFY